MYKIEFIPTGHVFLLPEIEARKLKDNFPREYLILEKNGKKFKDKIPKILEENNSASIKNKVLDK